LGLVRSNRHYRRFLLATIVSFMGSAVHVVGAAWLILQLTGQSYSVPLLLLISALPGILFAPLIGSVVDRRHPRRVLMATDLVSAIVVLVIPIAAVAGRLAGWELYVVEFVLAFAGQFYLPASRVLVRSLVTDGELLLANSTTTLIYQLGIALGALGGGLLITATSPVVALAVNGASFAFSLACFATLPESAPAAGGSPVPGGIWRDFLTGVGLLRDDGVARHLFVLYLVLQGAHRFLTSLLAPLVHDALRQPAAVQGLLQAVYSGGAVLAGLMIPVLVARSGWRATLLLGTLGVALMIGLFALARSLWFALPVYLVLAVLVQLWVSYQTAAQLRLPASAQGRVFAAVGLVQSASGVLIFAASAALLRLLPVQLVYAACAALVAVASARSLAVLWNRPVAVASVS
jgi:hypothetical protein